MAVVWAGLLVSGTAPAFGDPGRHASEHDSGSDRGRGDTDGHGEVRVRGGGPEEVPRSDDGIATPKAGETADGPRVESRRGNVERLAPSNSVERLAPSISASDPPATTTGESTPDRRGGSGSDTTAAPRSALRPPRVTFGNGRTPTARTGGTEPREQAPAEPALADPAPVEPTPPPPPPAPPPPAPAPSSANRVDTPPLVARRFVAAPAVTVVDPLWRIAGLLLIPAAGAVLGYRQARALQAADRLARDRSAA